LTVPSVAVVAVITDTAIGARQVVTVSVLVTHRIRSSTLVHI